MQEAVPEQKDFHKVSLPLGLHRSQPWRDGGEAVSGELKFSVPESRPWLSPGVPV